MGAIPHCTSYNIMTATDTATTHHLQLHLIKDIDAQRRMDQRGPSRIIMIDGSVYYTEDIIHIDKDQHGYPCLRGTFSVLKTS